MVTLWRERHGLCKSHFVERNWYMFPAKIFPAEIFPRLCVQTQHSRTLPTDQKSKSRPLVARMSALSTASIRDCYGADRLSQRGKQVDCTTILCQPLSSPEAKRGSFYQPLHFLPTPTTHQPTAPRGALFRSPLSPPPLLPLPTFSEK